MKLEVQSAGQHLLGWAKNRLRALTQLRIDLGLPTLRKTWKVGDILVETKSSDFGDLIRITGGTFGGFVALIYLRRLSPSGVLSVGANSPALLPFSKNAWKRLGISATFANGKPTVTGDVTRTPQGGTGDTLYVENVLSTAFGSTGASYTALGVIEHRDGSTKTLLELGTDGQFYKRVGTARTALSQTGSASVLDTFTSSADGKTVIASDTTGAIHSAAVTLSVEPNVTWVGVPDTLPYGTTRSTSSTTSIGTDTSTSTSSVSSARITSVASYPLSKAVAGTIYVDYTSTVASDTSLNWASFTYVGPGTEIVGSGGGQLLQSENTTATIRFPASNGATPVLQFVLRHSELGGSVSMSSTYDGVSQGFPGTGGWTVPRVDVTGTLTILYADPSVPIVFYEYTSVVVERTALRSIASGFYGLSSLAVEFSKATTTTRTIGVMVADRSLVLHEEQDVLEEAPTTTNPTEAGFSETLFGSNWFVISTTISGGSDITDDIVDRSFFSTVASARKIYPVGTAAEVVDRLYAFTAKNKKDWLASVTFDSNTFHMWRGTASNFDDVTQDYVDYVAASVVTPGTPGTPGTPPADEPTTISINALLGNPGLLASFAALLSITVPELIVLLIALRDGSPGTPGTPDVPDEVTGAQILANPAQFEIRAYNLTYV